jgi:hypothetical protein
MTETDYHPIDLSMPYEITKVMENGQYIVKGVSKIEKCPDCNDKIRYGGM